MTTLVLAASLLTAAVDAAEKKDDAASEADASSSGGGGGGGAQLVGVAAVAATALFFMMSARGKAKARAEAAAAEAAAAAARAAEEAKKSAAPAGPLFIYFGSQTGTAEGFAATLAAEAKERGFAPEVIDLEEFEADQLVEAGRAILLMATYGEGEPTDNAHEFSTWLKDADDGALADGGADGPLAFAVFGLGNRQYEHFNAMGKLVDERLAAIGGDRLLELGVGDDDANLDEDFETWKDAMWPAFCARFHPDGDGGGGGGAGNGKAAEVKVSR